TLRAPWTGAASPCLVDRPADHLHPHCHDHAGTTSAIVGVLVEDALPYTDPADDGPDEVEEVELALHGCSLRGLMRSIWIAIQITNKPQTVSPIRAVTG